MVAEGRKPPKIENMDNSKPLSLHLSKHQAILLLGNYTNNAFQHWTRGKLWPLSHGSRQQHHVLPTGASASAKLRHRLREVSRVLETAGDWNLQSFLKRVCFQEDRGVGKDARGIGEGGKAVP